MSWKLSDIHPRVLFNKQYLPLLCKRAETTHKPEFDALLQCAVEPAQFPDPGACNNLAFRLAFLYQVSGDKKHAALAARYLEEALKLGVNSNYGSGSARLKTLACCYDWLHDALPADFLTRVGQRALDQSQALYNSEEVDSSTFVAGHAINQIPYVLMAGLAVGDDFGAGVAHEPRPLPLGMHTHQAQEFVNDVLYRMEMMFPCYKHFMDGHSFGQSYAYSLAYIGELPYLMQLVEAGLGEKSFKQNAWFENTVEWYTYALRQDESFIRFGDYFCSSSVFSGNYLYRAMAAIASRYQNGVARWWTEKFNVSGVESDAFLFHDRDGVTPVSPDSLPRTRFFAPMGTAIARGDFQQGTVAAFKCTPVYLHNHCHRDQNQIVIYHKGELAIDSGAYDGYESPHWKNYYTRTIAHNTLVVHDPEEKMYMRAWELANDGGQRQVNIPDFTPRRYPDLFKECYRDGKILGYREGAGFSYVCGDASNCYSPKKLKRFVRHAIFVLDWPHKAAVSVIVFDEVELARPGLKPRILVHTVDEPLIDGRQITASHGGGRLELHVVDMPGNGNTAQTIEKIGGPGRECWIDGQNFPVDYHADENLSDRSQWHTPGAWRVEIAPAGQELATEFLTVWIPSDAGAPPAPAPKFEARAGGFIVRLGDRTFVLQRAGSVGNSTVASNAKTAEIQMFA